MYSLLYTKLQLSSHIFWQNFDPVPIRIFDEVNPHFGILIADDAHLRMFRTRRLIIIRMERKVKLLLPKVIWLRTLMQIRQFQLKIRCAIPEIDQCEALRLQPTLLTKAERLLIERHAARKIEHVKVHMGKCK